MHTDAPPYRLRPIDPATADALRARGGVRRVADEHPGYPCRQCLRDAEVGEELLLVSHDPFEPISTSDAAARSPYRCASPIFIHLHPCSPPSLDGELPAQLVGRRLSVRAFDADALMTDAVVIDGRELDATLRSLLDRPEVSWFHVHNAAPGCWAVAVDRS